MSLTRFVGALEEINQDTSGGIICSAGVKRDGAAWIIEGISYGNEMPLNVEHCPPPVGVFTRIGPTTVNGMPALAGVWKWGPDSVQRVAETRALVKAGVYNALSAGLDPLEREWRDGTLFITKGELLETSIVSVPADPLAKITQRSCDRGTMTRILRSLPAVPQAAIDRMMDQIRRAHTPSKPVGLMSAYERARVYADAQRSRTMQAWAAGESTKLDARERRKRDLDSLGALGESYGATRQ